MPFPFEWSEGATSGFLNGATPDEALLLVLPLLASGMWLVSNSCSRRMSCSRVNSCFFTWARVQTMVHLPPQGPTPPRNEPKGRGRLLKWLAGW